MNDPIPPDISIRRREIFLAAVERPSDKRAAFLDEACGGDSELRRYVEELLANHEASDTFLSSPAMVRDARPESDMDATHLETKVMPITEQAGERIGAFKLLQQIGEGGCGVVYMAEQEEPVRRRVALKIIKLGMDTRSVIARFEAERQALAMMDHPNISRVLDAGATETGRPYFVMELVRGIKITDYCDQNELPTGNRLKLFIQVCQAIQHAHQKGIIHRDIKPSNILVTLHDGVPVPKVIDFGIAKAIEQKLTDKTLFTQFQSFIGTPAYMSPEQAEMSDLDIDTRGDVYSLGVLLYELMTGRTPFDPRLLTSRGIEECRRTIREDEPSRPSRMLATMVSGELTTTANRRRTESRPLIQQMRGDLDWIVMKCLEKKRTRRYETAAALAADVQRYLDSEPITARPPSATYRLGKLLRKHRGLVAATGAVALALMLGTIISLGLAVRAIRAEEQARETARNEIQLRREAERERSRAEREKAAARLNEYVADINLARLSLKDGNLGRAVQLLQRHGPNEGETDLRGFEWRFLAHASKGDPHETLVLGNHAVQAMAISPDGTLLAVTDHEKVHVVSLESRKVVSTISPEPMFPAGRPGRSGRFLVPAVDSISFLDAGRVLATGSHAFVRFWSIRNWEPLDRSAGTASSPVAATFDGSQFATAMGRRNRREPDGIVLWDVATRQPTRSIQSLRPPMTFSRDRRWLAADSEPGIQLWPLQSSAEPTLLQNSSNLFGRVSGVLSDHPLAFSPDGNYLVAARNRVSERGVFLLGIWDVESGEEIGTLPPSPEQIEHTGVISSLAFSPDGKTLATAGMDHSIRLWDFERRELIRALYGHLTEIWSLAMSPDGRTLVSGDKDGRVKIWNTERQEPEEPLQGIGRPLKFSRDGATLAALDGDDAVVFVDLATGETIRRLSLAGESKGPFPPIALSDNLDLLAQGHRDGTVTLWNADANDTRVLKLADWPIHLLEVSGDGRHLIAGGRGGMPRWWDLHTGSNSLWDAEADRVLFSPSGETVFTLDRTGSMRIWDVTTRLPLVTLETTESISLQFSLAMAFSSDGTRIALALEDHSVGLWEAESGGFIGRFEGHMQPVFALDFSSDDRTLATAGADSTVRLWNVATRSELLIDRKLGVQLWSLTFSPDDQLLVGGGAFGSRASGLQIYHAPRSAALGDVAVR